MHRLVGGLILAALLAPSGVTGAISEGEGQAPFGLGAVFLDNPRLGKTVRLNVYMAGHYDSTATGMLRLILPAGVELVTGDSIFHGYPARRHCQWTAAVTIRERGEQQIRGQLTIQSGSGIDEGEFALPIDVRADTTVVQWSRLVRSETVRAGQRFRYGGRFLVPIEQSEELTQTDIERLGQRASGARHLRTMCSNCKAGLRATVPMVVFVAADGRVLEARPRVQGKRFEDALVVAAKTAIGQAQFRSAKVKGRAVADWVLTDVEVVSEK